MSVAVCQESTNIQLNALEFGGITFPPESQLKVDYVNGKKEGDGTVMSSTSMMIAKLHFHEDQLDGLCKFFNSKGMKTKECVFVNGVHSGWGCEYEDDKIIFEGIYKNGKRYSELRNSAMEGYLEEVKDEKIISIFKYTNNHTIEGKGLLFEYHGNRVSEVYECENGEKSVKRIQFENAIMIELNENGGIVYKGGFTGNPRNGFVRNGEGIENDGNNVMIYSGGWKNGEKDGNGLWYDSGILRFNGEWREGKPYGNGKLYNHEGDVIMERLWKNECDDLNNGVFRINDSCTIEIDKNELFVNELKPSGLFGCGRQWKRYPLNEVSKNEIMNLDKFVKMVIKNGKQLRELLRSSKKKRSVNELVIEEGCGNEKKDDLELCGFENLESIVVKKNALKNVNSLKISNNRVLKSIEIDDGDELDAVEMTYKAPFENTKSVVIESMMIIE